MQQFNNQRGQGLIEYLIIVAILAVGVLSVMRVLGHNIKMQFTNITAAITNQTPVGHEAIQAQTYRKDDMGNFFEGASDGSAGQR